MVSIERVSVLNSSNRLLVSDYDLTSYTAWLTWKKWGILFDIWSTAEFDLNTWTGVIQWGKAVVMATRDVATPIPNQKIQVLFEMLGTKTLTLSTKVFIELDNVKIQDPTTIEDAPWSDDFAKGLNIWEVKTWTSWPSHPNYLKLWEYNGSIWLDLRERPKAHNDNIDVSKQQNNSIILNKTSNYTFLWSERNQSIIATNSASWNIVHTLNPALFPTTNGFYEFTFVKSSADANTVTIDVWSGKTIDASQTYILSAQWESVTIVIQSNTFAKVMATSNKPLSWITIPAITKVLTAWEDMTIGKAYRKWRGTVNTTINLPWTAVNVSAWATVDIVSFTCDVNFYSSVINTITLSMNGNWWNPDWWYFVITDTLNNILYTSSSNTYTTASSKVYTFTWVNLAPGNYKLRYRSTWANWSAVASPNWSYSFIMDQLEYTDRCYIAKNVAWLDNVLWLVSSNVSAGNNFFGNLIGTQTWYTWLSNWSVYLQSDGSITNTTSTIKMWLQVATDTIFFNRSSKINTIVITKNITDATVTTQYANILWIKPKHVKVESIFAKSWSTVYATSSWQYNWSTQSCIYWVANSWVNLTSTTCIEIWETLTARQSGIIQNITDTTFEIAWTKVGAPASSNAQIMLTFYE